MTTTTDNPDLTVYRVESYLTGTVPPPPAPFFERTWHATDVAHVLEQIECAGEDFADETIRSITPVTAADDYARLRAAVDHMAEALGNGMTAQDAGTAFTCGEAESIADVFLAAGHDDAAATWLAGHATGDEDEDTHAGWDADDAQLHVQGLAQRIANGDDL